MHYRLLDESDGRRTIAVVMEHGELVVATLAALAAELDLIGSSVTGIGGFESALLGYFNPATQQFRENHVEEQVEVLSFTGNIAEQEDGTPKLHIHVVLGRQDATTRGGHLIEAVVRPTLEAIVTESPEHLHRYHDSATNLTLLKP